MIAHTKSFPRTVFTWLPHHKTDLLKINWYCIQKVNLWRCLNNESENNAGLMVRNTKVSSNSSFWLFRVYIKKNLTSVLCYCRTVDLGSIQQLGYSAVLVIYKGNFKFGLWLSNCPFLKCTIFFFNYLPIFFSEVLCVAKFVYIKKKKNTQKMVEHDNLGYEEFNSLTF